MDTNSYIYRQGTAPQTRAVVSQKSKIYGYSVGQNAYTQIGVITEFSHDESKSVDPVRGIGYGDMIAELVPGVTEPMTLSVNKTMLYNANLFQVMGYKGGIDGLVRSLKHHRWPFDIKQELVLSEIDTIPNAEDAITQSTVPGTKRMQALFTYYEGCWFNSYNASFTSDQAQVSESSSVTVTDIIDGTSNYGEYIDSGLSPMGNGGQGGAGQTYSLRFAQGGRSRPGQDPQAATA